MDETQHTSVVAATGRVFSLRHPPTAVMPALHNDKVTFLQTGDGYASRFLAISVVATVLGIIFVHNLGPSISTMFPFFVAAVMSTIALLRATSTIGTQIDFRSGTAEFTHRKYGINLRYVVPVSQVRLYVATVDIVRNPLSWNDGYCVVLEVGDHGMLQALQLDRDQNKIQAYLNALPASVRSLIVEDKVKFVVRMSDW